ncbi:MAG: DUF3667 domain-containing protein [Sediminibacterium sp.]
MDQDLITCKNCGNRFEGKFCNRCGEKVYQEKDKNVLVLIEETFHFITHVEGTFFTTLKSLFNRPGQISLDYCSGIRKKYFKPLSFFLLLVVIYLLFPLASGLNMPMRFHLSNPHYGAFATKKVTTFLTNHPGMSMETLAQNFALKSEKTSKVLLFLIIPLCAFILWVIGFKKRPYLYDQMVLSAEINSFFLMISFFVIPVIFIMLRGISLLFHFSFELNDDYIFTFTGQVITAIFVAAALRRFYRFGLLYTVLSTCIFMYFHDFIVYILYKFILFVVDLNLIH